MEGLATCPVRYNFARPAWVRRHKSAPPGLQRPTRLVRSCRHLIADGAQERTQPGGRGLRSRAANQSSEVLRWAAPPARLPLLHLGTRRGRGWSAPSSPPARGSILVLAPEPASGAGPKPASEASRRQSDSWHNTQLAEGNAMTSVRDFLERQERELLAKIPNTNVQPPRSGQLKAARTWRKTGAIQKAKRQARRK
jgi:hypothetical protein